MFHGIFCCMGNTSKLNTVIIYVPENGYLMTLGGLITLISKLTSNNRRRKKSKFLHHVLYIFGVCSKKFVLVIIALKKTISQDNKVLAIQT